MDKNITFHKALDNYLLSKKETLKEYSYFSTEWKVKKLKDIVADLQLKDFTTEELQDYVDDWSKNWSIPTIKSYVTIIKCTLKLNGYLIGNVKITSNKKSRMRLYSSEDIEKLENFFINDKVKVNYLPIAITMYTGARIGEVLALQWLDIDLDKRIIEISKNVVFLREEGRVKKVIQEPKTKASNRYVAIPNQLADILKKFQPENTENWDFYVCTGKNEPSETRSFQRSAERLLAKLGIQYRGFHAFRHSYATKMMESNVPVKAISDILGHSDITTTMNIYSHTTNDFKKKIVDDVFGNEELEKQKEKKQLYEEIISLQNMINELLAKIAKL